MAFPYVSASEDVYLENSLVSGFAEACGDDMGIANVAFHGSCSMDSTNHEETTSLHSVQVIHKLMWHDVMGLLNMILQYAIYCPMTGLFDQEDGR